MKIKVPLYAVTGVKEGGKGAPFSSPSPSGSSCPQGLGESIDPGKSVQGYSNKRMYMRIDPASKYVLTAINKLTGERMVISLPCGRDKCCALRDSFAKMLHRYSVYKQLKVEPARKWNGTLA